MKKIIIFISVLLLFSCREKETISGDLAFKLVNFTPQKGFEKKEAQNVIKYIDSIERNPNSNKDSIFSYLKTLKDNNLLECPQIKLKLKNDTVFKTVFMSKNEFQKIKKYDLNYLKSDKKIELVLQTSKITDENYYCEKILSINETSGETFKIK